MPGGPVREEEVRPLLMRVSDRVHESSGIQFSDREPMLKTHESGRYTQGRVYYRGPRNAPQVASIILDLSASEKVARPSVLREISHSFPDALPARPKSAATLLKKFSPRKSGQWASAADRKIFTTSSICSGAGTSEVRWLGARSPAREMRQ